MRKGERALVLPLFFLARFRSSPTTESLEQAKYDVDGERGVHTMPDEILENIINGVQLYSQPF